MQNFFARSACNVQPINRDAALAIKAANGFRSWGAYAARKFCQKNNVPSKLVRIARQLEAAQRAGI